jgi:predicted esterase
LAAHYKIRTEKTGHYFTHGILTEKTHFVWVCLHGYGQLGKYFIQRFEFLDPELHFIVVPEGLNRFYFEGVNDKPVASWMTKEDRLDEIADYVIYLESLRYKIGWERNENARIIYFGFSQGVTTLLRWLQNMAPRADYLLLWAGGFPDDILFQHRIKYFNQLACHYFLGDMDPYIKPTMLEDNKNLIAATGLDMIVTQYKGHHKVDAIVLKEWVDKNLHP